MITKGALECILDVCTHVQDGRDIVPLDEGLVDDIEERFAGGVVKASVSWA